MTITRRGFVGTVAAGMLVPQLRFQPREIERHSLLEMFTDKECSRYDFTAPFVVKGKAYASDARALARVWTREEEVDTATRKLPKNVLEVWDQHWSSAERKWRPLPDVPYQTGDPHALCPLCWERAEDCVVCEGEGSAWDSVGYPCTCPRCYGRGCVIPINRDCHICGGHLEGPDVPRHAEFGDKHIAVAYWEKLLKIPGCELNIGKNDTTSPILFRGEGGIHGIIMPLMREEGCT